MHERCGKKEEVTQMEKKTMGAFILALRKVNGLTQMELAEKLNVSNKAVSRWERDECLPDLSLIPAIAEIFHVTCDELLRGERMNTADSLNPRVGEKVEKQVQQMVGSVQTKLRVRSLIAVAIGAIGCILALAFNTFFSANSIFDYASALFAILSVTYIGFLGSIVFTIAALICESIFIILAFSAIKNSGYEGEAIQSGRKTMMRMAEKSVSAIVVLFATTLPYVKVMLVSVFIYRLLCVIFAVLLCLTGCLIAERIAAKKGLLDIPIEKRTISRKRNMIVIPLLFVSFALQVLFNWALPELTFADSIQFDTYVELKDYMETEVTNKKNHKVYIYWHEKYAMYYNDDYGYYYDMDPLSSYGTIKHSVPGIGFDSYQILNQDVARIYYNSESEDGIGLPATVYTVDAVRKAGIIECVINLGWIVLYLAEWKLCTALCRKKRTEEASAEA